jgi:16S rRNA (cytosine1402-N4)-methyltransferase
MSYHLPVMLTECLEGLNLKANGTYVDVTFGGGGHSTAILERLQDGKLFSFDQDNDALANANQISNRSFTFIAANFRHLRKYLKMHGISQVDGILADLGVSSHQIDAASRGFSTRFNADLDMRMDQSASITAKTIVNSYSERDLHRILGMYGEIRNAKTLAQAIIRARTTKKIDTVEELKKVLDANAPKHREFKYYAQVFQAIRIEVNDEMKALEEMLVQCEQVLKPGGRLVVMSYHSLEDRMVKNFINKGKIFGELDKDVFGNPLKPLNAINRKPITPSEAELEVNNRSRSAKLRIAEKI